MNTIDPKALKLLDIIDGFSEASQRELAEKSGLSLGMVNLILRRLVRTGYIKVSTMDRRKMRYLLTPKGLKEKSHTSYRYLLRTLRVYEQYREKIAHLIEHQQSRGVTRFSVVGEGDLADLVSVILSAKGLASQAFKTMDGMPPSAADHAVLYCGSVDNEPVAGISILEALLNTKISQGELHELV